jgi:hypothetical protein
MTALLVFTEKQPILVMASKMAITNGRLEEHLKNRGIETFIAHEVPLDALRQEYGMAFERVEGDIRNGEEMRVLDSKGSHVFARVRFADLGQRIQNVFPA